MKFTKMQGLGNDYVYINGFTEQVNDKSELAKKLSDRHFGIGSDGIIFINPPSALADFEMEMYNADGSRAEMCGNGIRCVAKYVYDNRMTDKDVIAIESMGIVREIEIIKDEDQDHVAKGARVNMGVPILSPALVPCVPSAFMEYAGAADDDKPVINRTMTVAGKEYKTTCVSMGNPHAVIFVDEPVANLDLNSQGSLFENHEAFPKRVNTEFVRVLNRNTVEMRVWERGTGETLACGTGATATAVACILNGLTDNVVTVKLLGGDLTIEWKGTSADSQECAFMTGAATTVFTGEIDI